MPYIGTSPSNGVRRVHTYTATASQTTFTGASSEGVTLSYADTNYIDVFQNGVLLGSADYTSTSGTSVVLAQACSESDLIVIIVYDVFSVADTVSKTNGGSFDSAVTVSGAFTSQGIDDNANATAITIDSSERVMIGTTTEGEVSADDLTIATSGNTGITIRSGTASNGAIYFSDGTSGDDEYRGILDYDHNDNKFRIFTNASERFKIESNGEIGINESSPSAQLHITSPNLAGTRDALRLKNDTDNTGGNFIRFENSVGGFPGEIEQTGTNTVAYRTSSDHRLKENVSDMTDATTRLKLLKPKRFNFITEPDTTLDGFLAHEVQSVVPEAISGTHNGLEVWKEGEELPDGVSVGDNKLDDDGNTIPKYQGIDQSKLVPLLVKTIQELEARITALENAE